MRSCRRPLPHPRLDRRNNGSKSLDAPQCALGDFFPGSATIANLTFGGIQFSIAESLDLDHVTLLSLQSVGAAMGNMVCINNIVAVCSILGLTQQEGYILKRTIGPMVLYGVIAVISARLLFGFV